MEKSRRKEMEFQLRRSEILNQAEKIFALKGFYNTTMADIANASGFAIGSLYQYFAGKENLYTTMVSEKLDRMYAEIRESVNGEENVIDKIKKLIRTHFKFVEDNIDFCNLFIRGEGVTLSKGETVLRDKMIEDYLSHVGFVESIMNRGMEAKTLKAMEPRMMAYTLLGIIRSFIYYWMLTRKETLLSDKADCALAIFLKGVGSEVAE